MPIRNDASAIALAALKGIMLFLCSPLLIRAELLPIKTFSSADGLPRDAVYKVRQDARGFIWMCTSEGLVRFDGYGFKVYTEADGLSSRSVTDFLQSRDGRYWIGTRAGLFLFNPGGLRGKTNTDHAMFSVVAMAPPPRQPRYGLEIHQIYEDRRGTIWITAEDGLTKLIEENGRIFLRRVELPYQNKLGYLPISSILMDGQCNLWVSANHGMNDLYSSLYRIFPNGRIETYTIPRAGIAAMLEAKDGTIWVGLTGLRVGLCRLVESPGTNVELFSRCYSANDGLPNAWILSLRQTGGDGAIWVGTAGGLTRFRPDFNGEKSQFERIKSDQGICDREIYDICEDREGNLWFSTTCGAVLYMRKGFSRFTDFDGLQAQHGIFSIFNDQKGQLIVVNIDPNRNLFLNVFDGRRFFPIKPNTPPKTNHGWGWGPIVVNTRQNDWWIPTEDGVLYRFRRVLDINQLARAQPQAYTAKDGFTDRMVWRMYEDARGDLWISTSYLDKLLRWDHQTEKLSQLSAASDAPNPAPRPNFYVEDPEGALWMLSDLRGQHYLLRRRDGKIRVFGPADGLPQGDRASWILLDRKNRLWFTTDKHGVGRIDHPNAEPLKIAWYNRETGLSSNNAKTIAEDPWGRIYIGTIRGVDCLNPETGETRSFTAADGLPKDQIYLSALDSRGALWFGSQLGIARYLPEPPGQNSRPAVYLTAMRVAGAPQPVSEIGDLILPARRLASSQSNVGVEFLSPGATADRHVRYQYKLEGLGDWSEPTRQRSVEFANLAAGSYRFLVRAINDDGETSETPASVSFTVAAPFWRREWFLASALAGIGAFAYAAYRYRVAQLLAMERMRTRIATDLHDEVGSSLSQIAILTEVAHQQLTRNELRQNASGAIAHVLGPMEKVAVTSREAIDAMSDIVWAIAPHRDQLSDLSQRMRHFASDTLTARDIMLRFHSPETNLSLDSDARRQIFLIFKECVNNIARHANCTEVDVVFTLSDHHLSLRIQDNGKGFAETVRRPEQNGGNGLHNIKRRATQLGGSLEISSQHGQGSTILLKIPLPRRRNLVSPT